MNLRPLALPLVLLSSACFAACSSGGDGDDPLGFNVRSSDVSAFPTSPVAISGRWIAFLASEGTTGAGGTDFNQDGDMIDASAVVIDAQSNVETRLGVAVPPPDLVARPFAWLEADLYFVVYEQFDGRSWNADLDFDDWVLLHWKSGMTGPEYVDDVVAPGTVDVAPLVAVGTNLFYSSAAAPGGALESNLRQITTAAPIAPVAVPTLDLAGSLSPLLVGQEEGLVRLVLDEEVEQRDLNGDGFDGLEPDRFVLALVDGTTSTPIVHNTALALASAASPWRAKKSASNDWQVAFLVSETAQGPDNLNSSGLFDPNWQPAQCGAADNDTDDDVVHYLFFKNWGTDAALNPIRNTGLAGTDKIAIANGFVATIQREAAQGNCDLNSSGLVAGRVVRWTRMVTGTGAILPPTNAANLRAVADVAGGTHGLAELDNRFVIVVDEESENEDVNADGDEGDDLVAWAQPSASNANVAWDFSHGSANNRFVGASWLAEQRDRTRLALAFQENVLDGIPGTPDNLNGPGTSQGADDNDLDDSLPTFPDFSSFLSFPGVAIAVDTEHPGIRIASNLGLYRVSEQEDSRDWNDDGDEDDFILFATSLQQGISRAVAALLDVDRLAVEINAEETSPKVAAFLGDETQTGNGVDLNGDQDEDDVVLQYFRF